MLDEVFLSSSPYLVNLLSTKAKRPWCPRPTIQTQPLINITPRYACRLNKTRRQRYRPPSKRRPYLVDAEQMPQQRPPNRPGP